MDLILWTSACDSVLCGQCDQTTYEGSCGGMVCYDVLVVGGGVVGTAVARSDIYFKLYLLSTNTAQRMGRYSTPRTE